MKLKHSVSMTALAFILVMGGCAKKEAKLDQSVTESWIKSHVTSDLPKRDISEADAQKALEKFELWESGDNVSWDERTGSNGNYVFKNLVSVENDFSIGEVKITGLRMVDEDMAIADHFEITDLSATDPDESVVIGAKSIQFSFPNVEDMISVFKEIEETGVDSETFDFQELIKNGDLNFSMGEGYIDDLSIKAAEANFTIDFMGWAEEEGDRKLSMLFKDIDGSASEPGKAPVVFSLENMSMKGLDLEYYDNMLSNNIAGMNPFDPQMQSMSIDNFKVQADHFFMDLPKMKSWYSEKKNGKFYSATQMPSMKFGFDGDPEEPSFQEMKTAMNDLGYESVDLSIEAKSNFDETADYAEVETGRLSMKDGFDMNFDYKVSGLKSMMEKMGESMEGVDYSDPAYAAANMEMIMVALKALKLHGLTFEFDDNSILEKGFNLAAQKQGVGADLIRQQAKGGVMMSTMAAKSEYQAELSKDFADNLVKLIDEGGKFTISMKPEDGFDIGKTVNDYTVWQQARMEYFQSQMSDETVTEITEPEAFDMDGVIKALNIDFVHAPD